MGPVWTDQINNTHTLPMTLQYYWLFLVKRVELMTVLSVHLLRAKHFYLQTVFMHVVRTATNLRPTDSEPCGACSTNKCERA